LDFYKEIARASVGSYPSYALSGTYTSAPFNTGSSGAFNVIEWKWSKTNINCGSCTVRIQIQTAPDAGDTPGVWSPTWSGPEGEDGDETDYYTLSTGELIHTDHNNDQWVRYRAALEGDSTATPILEEVKLNYQ